MALKDSSKGDVLSQFLLVYSQRPEENSHFLKAASRSKIQVAYQRPY